MKKLSILLIAIFLFFSFTVFSKYVKKGSLRDFDFALTVKIQERVDKSTHLRTSVFIGDLLEGAVILASPGISVIAVVLLTGWGFVTGYGRNKIMVFLIPAAFAGLVLAEIYGKTFVHHPSPPFIFLKNPTTHFPVHYSVENYSYPSGHAARSVFLAITAITVLLKTRIKQSYRNAAGVIIAICAAPVSLSVIYLGHHWMSDVVGGWLIGSAFALVYLIPSGFIPQAIQQESPERKRAIRKP